MNDSHVLMVKDNSARTAQFVPELTVKLSVLKYLMLSSKKQVKCLTVWMMYVTLSCTAIVCRLLYLISHFVLSALYIVCSTAQLKLCSVCFFCS
jgi:hypothetical protein